MNNICEVYLSGGNSVAGIENKQDFKNLANDKHLHLDIMEFCNTVNGRPETMDYMASMRATCKYVVFIIAAPFETDYHRTVLIEDLCQIMEVGLNRGRDHVIPIFLRQSKSGTIPEMIWDGIQSIIDQLDRYYHIPIFYNIKSAVDHIERLEKATTREEYMSAMNYRDTEESIYYHENEIDK